MALSYTEYVADGSTSMFPSKLYLRPEHLVVTVDAIIQPNSAYIVEQTQVTFNTPPPDGAVVRIGRNTSQEGRLTDYRDGSLLTADVLDNDAFQLFYMAQEALDVAIDIMPLRSSYEERLLALENSVASFVSLNGGGSGAPSRNTFNVNITNSVFITSFDLVSTTLVFLNGVLLANGIDLTFQANRQLSLTTPANNGDILEVVGWSDVPVDSPAPTPDPNEPETVRTDTPLVDSEGKVIFAKDYDEPLTRVNMDYTVAQINTKLGTL
jgi:hypothetical protein